MTHIAQLEAAEVGLKVRETLEFAYLCFFSFSPFSTIILHEFSSAFPLAISFLVYFLALNRRIFLHFCFEHLEMALIF